MTSRTITVSRSGLTECPACGAFIKLATDVVSTACPFCSASLLAQRTSRRGMLAAVLGRGAAVAALLGVAVAGCTTTGSKQKKPPLESDAGRVDIRPAPDVGQSPEYGIAPAPDDGPTPLYGIPSPPQRR